MCWSKTPQRRLRRLVFYGSQAAYWRRSIYSPVMRSCAVFYPKFPPILLYIFTSLHIILFPYIILFIFIFSLNLFSIKYFFAIIFSEGIVELLFIDILNLDKALD